MIPGQEHQLEKLVDDALKNGNFQPLDVFLQEDINEETTIKCSKLFLSKLDKLVSKGFKNKDVKAASLGFTILYKCGKNLSTPGGQGLLGITSQGLVKMIIWIRGGLQRDETLLNLAEDFFDSLMVVHTASIEGTYQITESLLYPIGKLATDPRIYIMIQREAIRKLNIILDKIPVELKKEKKILSSQDASDVMIKLAGQILDGGDYDLQTALMEALCRMATPDQRRELADRWFTMEYVARSFVKIRDSEFETDCRNFLNLVNGMQGDRRRVFSYPCLEAYLDKYELLMPSDEKLQEFWIDFNLGSQSISFYFSLADEESEESQWDTICITDKEVHSYTVTEEGRTKVLRLKLSEVVCVGVVEGSSLTVHFSSSLDILQAARSVFGHAKNKSFVGKSSTSVVKTTVKILMDDSGSQAIPDSQMPMLTDKKIKRPTAPCWLPAPPATPAVMKAGTPARRRISESTYFITSSTAGSVHGASPFSAVVPVDTPSSLKGKPALEMVCSYNRQDQLSLGELKTTANTTSHSTTPSGVIPESKGRQPSKAPTRNTGHKYKKCIPLETAVKMVQADEEEQEPLEHSFVPDTQPTKKNERSIVPQWKKLSVTEMIMMPTQKMKCLPRAEPRPGLEQQQVRVASANSVSVTDTLSHQELHTELTQRLQEVVNERNQAPGHKEVARAKEKGSVDQEASQKIESVGRRSTGPAPKQPNQQPAGKRALARRKDKSQKTLEPDPAQLKAKTIPTNLLLENTRGLTIKTTGTLSSKKKRDAEVAGNMAKHISGHYESNTSTTKATAENIPPTWVAPLLNRSIFEKSWLPSAKKETSAAPCFKKSYSSSSRKQSADPRDVYAFNVDTPSSNGKKSKSRTESSAIDSSDVRDSWALPSTTKNGQPAPKQEKRYVKKHLFSDTDTDRAMTEVSWLKDSARKPKPKITNYTREGPAKTTTAAPDNTYGVLHLSPHSAKERASFSKERPQVKAAVEQLEKATARSSRPAAASRRPQRAAASSKTYKEPDTDDSQSESEPPPAPKKQSSIDQQERKRSKKPASKTQPAKACRMPDSDSHGSQSEAEQLAAPKQGKRRRAGQKGGRVMMKEASSPKQTTKIYSKSDSDSQSESVPTPKKSSCGPKQNAKKTCLEMTVGAKGQGESWASRLNSFLPSPPPMEKMRSVDRSTPGLDMTLSPLTPLGSPPFVLPVHGRQEMKLPDMPRSTLKSKGDFQTASFHSTRKKSASSKTRPLLPSRPLLAQVGRTPELPDMAELSPIQGPALSPSCHPLLTSTALESNNTPSSHIFPAANNKPNRDVLYGSCKDMPVSQISLSQSSRSSVPTAELEVQPTAAVALANILEKTPETEQTSSQQQQHMSGPSQKNHIRAVTSNSEEDERDERDEWKKSKKRAQYPARMKPRKLFKSSTKAPAETLSSSEKEEENREEETEDVSFKACNIGYRSIKTSSISKTAFGSVEVSPEGELSHMVVSSRVKSTSHWEADLEDEDADPGEDVQQPGIKMGSMCREFSSVLQRKFQSRSRRMQVYTKQSLKTVEHHVSSLSMQVSKYRTQRLEQIQAVLMDEIKNLEQDDLTLKNMEKDLTMYWKKQATAFHSYHGNGAKRLETLKETFQSNVCPSLVYEEEVFTSQMGLMRKDMKSIQDRLFKEMQSEEMHNVRRGLQALLLPPAARF